MHRTARTAPGTGSARPRVAVLAAVVLVLLAALGIAGLPPGATSEPVARAVAGADRHVDTPPRADDGCGTVCAVRAATRPESHSEHPAPRGHLVTCAPGTDVTPTGSAPPSPTPDSPGPSCSPRAKRA
ncbi:hypothetical protein [Streptomyces azureus]|uniref:Uncharacterized protein n=1 Tax=Streptomyces azureus TaxID=146537 RepID=A0A0K8PCG2_STRAJ|nr:hypothetical protein [Streptomyces azureus]GAP45560.1 uncharacterized protein SAZU_0290 [Streptomyces azureus]